MIQISGRMLDTLFKIHHEEFSNEIKKEVNRVLMNDESLCHLFVTELWFIGKTVPTHYYLKHSKKKPFDPKYHTETEVAAINYKVINDTKDDREQASSDLFVVDIIYQKVGAEGIAKKIVKRIKKQEQTK